MVRNNPHHSHNSRPSLILLRLIPTEIFPTAARAQGTAVSVIIWGLANFTITLITPILFRLKFWIYLVFAGTNLFAGVWTFLYSPETGNRTLEDNQDFFQEAKKQGSWRVSKVRDGEFRWLPYPKPEGKDDGESQRIEVNVGKALLRKLDKIKRDGGWRLLVSLVYMAPMLVVAPPNEIFSLEEIVGKLE